MGSVWRTPSRPRLSLWRGDPLGRPGDVGARQVGAALAWTSSIAVLPRSWPRPSWHVANTANGWRSCTTWSRRSPSASAGGRCSWWRCTGVANRPKHCARFSALGRHSVSWAWRPARSCSRSNARSVPETCHSGPKPSGVSGLTALAEPDAAQDALADLEGQRPDRPRTFANNLPVQLTSFVGRGAELAGVAAALHDARLVTVTGAGGVGKTRLAIRVAADVLCDVPDGAWFCDLAPAASGDDLAHVVAAAVGARIRPDLSAERSVIDHISETKLLILLDNCEHLLEATAQFAEALLVSCPRLRILATSRERLGVAGEQVWPLGPLSVPEASGLGSHDRSEAATLFADRAGSAKPAFTISTANAEAVDEICRRLDGVPLAIELAAARIPAMSPAEIAARLDERFRLLTGGPRAAVERHQTLRATIDWSFSLCSPDREAHLRSTRRLLRDLRLERRRSRRGRRRHRALGCRRRARELGRQVHGCE